MKEIELKNKRVTQDKLIPFGFAETPQGFVYSQTVMNGQFELKLVVTKEGKTYSQLIEIAFGDEYVLHSVPDAQGEFVGRVRESVGAVLEKFEKDCCETNVFKGEQSRAVAEYVRKTYGDELQFLWERFPENAVFRRKDTRLWYGVAIALPRRKLGFDSDETAEILVLRMRTEDAAKIVDGKKYLVGYHMNKKTWFTIVLDGSVSEEEIFRRIDESYNLAVKSAKSRKR